MKFSIPAMSRANEFNLNDTKYWLPSSANTKGQGSLHQVILRHYVATRIRQKSLCLKGAEWIGITWNKVHYLSKRKTPHEYS